MRDYSWKAWQIFCCFCFVLYAICLPLSQLWATVKGAASLTQCSSLYCIYFELKITGSLVMRLDSKAWPSTWCSLNRGPPSSEWNTLTHLATLPNTKFMIYGIINFNVHRDTVEDVKGDLKLQKRYKLWRVPFLKNYFYIVEALDTI